MLTDPATFDNIAGNFQGKVDTRLQALSSVQCTFYLLPVLGLIDHSVFLALKCLLKKIVIR